MQRRNTLSFPNFDVNKIGSARQAASSAFSTAFNTVVAQPVTSIKNNISSTVNSSINSVSSSSNSTNSGGGGGNSSGKTGSVELVDDSNEDTSEVKQDLSDKASNKFFQVFPINKTVNIISSTLPAKNQTQKSNLNSSETENSTFVQTASSVLNKINPFELSSTLPSDTISNQSPKSAPHTDSTLKRFLFTAASNLSFDKTDRFIPDNVTYEVPILEEQLQYNEKSFSYDQELNEEMLEQQISKNIENGSSLSNSRASSLKRRSKPPVGSIEHDVVENETIEKIALKWNTTPSEILRMNRLATRTIFPGQKIYVPDPNYVPPPPSDEPKLAAEISNSETSPKPEQQQQQQPSNTSNSGGFSFLRWKTNSKPGHAEPQKSVETKDENRRGSISRRLLSDEEAKKLDEECMQRFLKINCKIVTRTKGCYDGVLIVTPSALMFDPFDLNATNTTIVSDETSVLNETSESTKQRTTSTSSSSSVTEEASAIVPIEIISNIIMYQDLTMRDVQEYFEYKDRLDIDLSEHKSRTSSETDEEVKNEKLKDQRRASGSSNHVTFVLDNLMNECSIDEIKENQQIVENKKSDKNDESSNCENVIPSSPTEISQEVKLEEHSDAPTLVDVPANLSFDAKETEKNANPDLTSCYLCVKVNNNKDFFMCPLNRKMKNRLRSEFWFQINDTNNDKIFAFFLEWKSDPTFSIASQSDQNSKTNTVTRRFQVVRPHQNLTDLLDDSLKDTLRKKYSSTNRLINKLESFTKDWEMVNLQELELKLKTEKDIENEYKTLPTLMNESLILKEDHLRKLNINLIARAVGYNWVLSFSTEEHGFSLNTLYRKLADVEGPCLIVVKDTANNVFGAMSSTKLYQSEHFYGTGESFLFTFWPSFRVFKWTGEDNFFTRGTNESISFGCGGSSHGLWFDGDLLNGHSQRTKTYDNDVLTSNENFTIASLEVWTFND